MPWACDSTHCWPGVTHSTRVAGCCSFSSNPSDGLSVTSYRYPLETDGLTA